MEESESYSFPPNVRTGFQMEIPVVNWPLRAVHLRRAVGAAPLGYAVYMLSSDARGGWMTGTIAVVVLLYLAAWCIPVLDDEDLTALEWALLWWGRTDWKRVYPYEEAKREEARRVGEYLEAWEQRTGLATLDSREDRGSR